MSYLIIPYMEAVTILIILFSLCCTVAFLLYLFSDEKTITRQSTQKTSAPRDENGMFSVIFYECFLIFSNSLFVLLVTI